MHTKKAFAFCGRYRHSLFSQEGLLIANENYAKKIELLWICRNPNQCTLQISGSAAGEKVQVPRGTQEWQNMEQEDLRIGL